MPGAVTGSNVNPSVERKMVAPFPFDDDMVMAGHGTVGLEIVDLAGPVLHRDGRGDPAVLLGPQIDAAMIDGSG